MEEADRARPRRRIVVGVDGSPAARSALRWAIEQAKATGADVEAVYAWKYPISFGAPVPLLPGVDIAAEAGTALDAAIAAAEGDTGVTVTRLVVLGDPAEALLRQSAHADLLVVGEHGRDEVARAMLGSVSQYCVHHAPCPVVVVRVGT
ncbi:universal stress protein [Glycomyces sp. NPDC049804]|uniref:universal stress protein n=1 Tax=Glycomyces sp. NPDC049804 TaxID=3154363 RepID=UPI003435D249